MQIHRIFDLEPRALGTMLEIIHSTSTSICQRVSGSLTFMCSSWVWRVNRVKM